MKLRARYLLSALLGMAIVAALAPLGWAVSDHLANRAERDRAARACAAIGGVSVDNDDGFRLCVLAVLREAPRNQPPRTHVL